MCNKNYCFCAIIASILLGVGVAFIFYEGLVTTISVLLYLTLAFGIVSLLTLLFKVLCGGRNKICQCINCCLISNIVGAIISSIFALTVTALEIDVVASAIIVGVVAYFLTNLIISLIKFIICLFCSCEYR